MFRRREDFDAAAFQEAMARGDGPDPSRAIEPVPVTVQREEPLAAELRAFVAAARHGSAPVVDADAAIRALEAACEIERLLHEES